MNIYPPDHKPHYHSVCGTEVHRPVSDQCLCTACVAIRAMAESYKAAMERVAASYERKESRD